MIQANVASVDIAGVGVVSVGVFGIVLRVGFVLLLERKCKVI